LQPTTNNQRLENIDMNMIELASGTVELNDSRWQSLRRVLEMILPHWIDSTILGGKGIQLFLLKDSNIAECGRPEEFPPIVALRALREGVTVKELGGYEKLVEMRPGTYPDPIIERVQKIFEDAPTMKLLCEAEEQATNPKAKLGQGDGCFRSYKIIFSTSYYNTFLHIYLSHIYTPA